MVSMLHRIVDLFCIISLSLRGIPINAFPLFGTDSGCGGQLTAPNGIIRSPGYPQNYPKNKLCVWIISVPDVNSTINLKFQTFSLERHPNCRYDYILIRDGDSQLSPILGKFCGNSIPNDINSKCNKLWIRFYSDAVITGQGFTANYTQSNDYLSLGDKNLINAAIPNSCGKRLEGTSGEIQSPHFRKHYPGVIRCIWLIDNNDPYYVIHINFDLLKINQNQQCLFDYIMVEDISGDDARILGRFCGSVLPSGKIIGQKLRITYQSEDISGKYGFKLKWLKTGKDIEGPKSQTCGGTDVSTTGFLRSNDFPDNYQNNINCTWKILAPEESMKIQLRFANFDLESSPRCMYDAVSIYDGPDRHSPLLGRYCGQQIPDLIEATQKQMLVVFETDSSDTASGFEALWIAVANSNYKTPSVLPRQPRDPDYCGGILTSFNGTLTSPNYPNKYPPDIDCTWIIKADSKHQIKLTFQSFEIEKDAGCTYDKISIRDGDSPESRIINEGCGDETPSDVTSNGGSLWIRFRTDGSKEMSGFSAKWQFLAKSGQMGCGHIFQSESGELSSPDYPNAQKARTFCTWTIEAPPHKRIELTFKDINMKASASCLYGFIQVLDGDSNDSPELGRFCQDFLPRSILSSKNKIVIGYQSDGTADSRGFKLEWRSMNERQDGEKPVMLSATPCNRTLTTESGTIVLGKGIRFCKWRIQPSTGKHITLSVIKANIIPNSGCNLERLYIRNGYTPTAPFLMKICEPTQATSATSFTNVLSIEYELRGESNKQDVILQWSTMKENMQNKKPAVSCGAQKVPLPDSLFTLAKPGMVPWMAALYSGSGVVYCGASILSSTWLVTAAHCLKRYPFYAFRKVAIGDLNVFEIEPTEQFFDIKLFHIHPEYNSLTQENDIALVKIEGQIAFNDNINPICLPEDNAVISRGVKCFVAGWGAPSFLGNPANRLFIGKIPIVSSTKCNETNAYKGRIKSGMLCAGSPIGGIDTCHGDGGGPLACKVSDGRFILAGVTSWGNGCGHPERYGVYSDLKNYVDWIYSIVTT